MLCRASLIALLLGACIAKASVAETDSLGDSDYDTDSELDLDLLPLPSVPSEASVEEPVSPSQETNQNGGRNSPGIHSRCEACDISRCEPIGGACIGGYTLDACGCCPTCSRLVGEYCNNETIEDMHMYNGPEMIWYGRCGNDLECVTENAFVSNLLDGEPQQVKICECKKRGKVCGTDGNTYSSICALKQAAARKSQNPVLQMRSSGYCSFGPKIVTKPTDITVNKYETSNALMCEASGYPIPAILWTFTRPDGTTVSIPSDDKDVSVITRGGQSENRVSSWVQIIKAEKRHEGTYTCYAEISGLRAVQEDAELTVA